MFFVLKAIDDNLHRDLIEPMQTISISTTANINGDRLYRATSGDRASTGRTAGEALDALQFMSAMNAFPNSDVPSDAFGRAYDYFKQQYKRVAVFK